MDRLLKMVSVSAFKSAKEDGVLAWMICINACISNAIVVGIDNSFGVVIGSLMTLLNCNTSTVSWIQSIHSTTLWLFASISSNLINRYGFRRIIIIGTVASCLAYTASTFAPSNVILLLVMYGIIGGAGSGLLYTPGSIACAHYFEKYRAIATGMAMSGNGLGTICVAHLANFVNVRYGVKWYFIALAGISSITMVFGLVTSPLHEQNTEANTENNKEMPTNSNDYKTMTDNLSKEQHQIPRISDSTSYEELDVQSGQTDGEAKEIDCPSHNGREANNEGSTVWKDILSALTFLKDARMSLYCLVHVMYELAFYVPVIFLPELMFSKVLGLSKEANGGTIISVLGFAHMLGKVFTGAFMQYAKASPIICSAISLLLLAGGCFGLSVCTTYEEFIGVTFVYGLFLASIDVYIPLILINMFGNGNLKDSYGLIMLAKVLTPLWGPPAAGAVKDWTGKYSTSFYAAGACHFCAAMFNFLVMILMRNHKNVHKEIT